LTVLLLEAKKALFPCRALLNPLGTGGEVHRNGDF